MYNPIDTAGPMPNANNNVPKPTAPPSNQPNTTAVTSIVVLTEAMGKFVRRCNPVIKRHLRPHSRLRGIDWQQSGRAFFGDVHLCRVLLLAAIDQHRRSPLASRRPL